ncbi:MAG: hypothetical protein AAF611_11655 [Bacteroidota bacterium]
MIKNTGQIITNYGSKRFPLVSPKDIAVVAAKELIKPKGNLFEYIVSSEHTGQEIATALGTAIGKPDLQWNIISDKETKIGMEQNGIPSNIAVLFTEMYQSLENGRLTENYIHHKPSKMGNVKLIDFANDFAKIYQQKKSES